jgi:hypothetical protein
MSSIWTISVKRDVTARTTAARRDRGELMKPIATAWRKAPGALVWMFLLAAAGAAGASPHTFVLTYRDFGPVTSASGFTHAKGYSLRFEGCYARGGDEAICGFTLRATKALTITNAANLSHAADAEGVVKRTCCMFVQGEPPGYPITAEATVPPGIAVLNHPLEAGRSIGLMLRVPDYRKGGPLGAITFSAGHGDPGVTFPARVEDLP